MRKEIQIQKQMIRILRKNKKSIKNKTGGSYMSDKNLIIRSSSAEFLIFEQQKRKR